MSPTLTGAAPVPLEISGIDPRVAQLALASGLFQPKPGSPDIYELNPEWFTNPIEHTATALKTNGSQLAALLGELLGSVGGHALGIPQKDPGDLGTWYPILNPDTQEPTGFYLTSNTVGNRTVFGIGTNYTWDLALSSGLAVRAYGTAPIVAVGNGTFELALGQDGYPISAGLEVIAPTPLIDQYGISIRGMRLSASLGLLPEPQCDLSLVVVQLKLPGDAQPSDRSLADLEQLTGEQILSTMSTLFLAALADATGQQNDPRIAFVLPVLGLSSQLPASLAQTFPDGSLPMLRWDQLATAFKEGDVSRPFKDWFNALLASPEIARAWLACIQGLEGISAPAVNGSGTRAEPYQISLLTAPAGALSFTVATTVDGGRRTFYPGLVFTGTKLALGASSAALRIAANLELAQFALSTDGVSADPTSLCFEAGIELVGKGQKDGKDDALFDSKIAGQNYTFGSLSAGLSIGDANGILQVIPSFTFNNVVTPSGSYDSLDLTQPGEILQKAEQELFGLVNSALQKLFGIGPGSEGTPGYAIAALLGIVAPSTGDSPVAWPADLAPPLSVSQLSTSLRDPIGAIGNYYSKLLSPSTLVDGKVPFSHLLGTAASLFQATTGGFKSAVTGSGTVTDPWLAPITAVGNLNAALEAYAQPLTSPAGQRLTLGFVLSPRLDVTADVTIALDCSLRVLGLDLTTSGVSAQILPGLGVALTLPKGVTTPAIAGASVTVAESGLLMSWSPYDGWQWSMHVAQPVVVVGNEHFPIGQDMDYRAGDSLEALVVQQAKTFAGILPRILGMALMRADSHAGLVFNGVLGLLPNLQSFMPAGVTWPADMPVLTLSSFDDPLGALRSQIDGLFATADRLKATLQLIGWCSSGGSAVPAIQGNGTVDDPFHLPFGLLSQIGVAVWSDAAAGTIGIGIDRSISVALSTSLQANTRVTVRLVNGSLSTATLVPATGIPGATITCTLSNPNGLLVAPTLGVSLDSLIVGLDLAVAGSVSQPQISVSPLFELTNLVLPELSAIARINVAQLATDPVGPPRLAAIPRPSEALLQQALDLALQQALPTVLVSNTANKAYELLATMGIALPRSSGALGINPAGWRALMADPLTFTRDRLRALASDPQTRTDLCALFQQATGVSVPTVPTSVLETLSAFGLLNDADAGYLPVPSAFVQLLSHPVTFVSAQFDALVADRTRLQALLSDLTQAVDPQPFGPFRLQVLAGPVVRMSIPPGTVKAGTLAEFSGGLAIDLGANAEGLTIDARIYNPQTQLALISSVCVHEAAIDPAFTLSLAFGDGSVPSAEPLTIYPFDPATFVPALARVAPAYSLSVLVSEVIDPKVLQPYPLTQAVFSALGIAEKDTAGTWRTRSLLGLFDDPLGWLLSGSVLGRDGHLDIQRLSALLGQVPEVSNTSLGLGVSRITNGLRVSGLPYGIVFDLTADATANRVRLAPALGTPLTIANNRATLQQLAFGLTLGPDFQPGLDGAVAMSATMPGVSSRIGVRAGYDQDFFVSVGDGTANGANLQLVPFPGWQPLVQAAGQLAAQQLLPDLAAKLVQALHDSGAPAFANALSTAGANLEISSLVTALVAAAPDEKKLETAALSWLLGRLSNANANQTAQAVVALLQAAGVKVDSQGGLIKYQPSKDLPVTLLIGANSSNLVGLWAAVTLPSVSILQIGIDQTGIGMPFDPSTGALTSTTPRFQTGITLSIPISGEACAPRFQLSYDNDKQTFVAGLDPMGTPGRRSDLYREVLPDFFGKPADLAEALEAWLVDVLRKAAPRYVSVMLLNHADVKKWLTSPFLAGSTPGTVLQASHLLTRNNGSYAMETFDNLQQLTIHDFLAGLLKALLSTQFTVITFGHNGDKGSIVIGPSAPGATDYGVRLIATGLSLPSAPNFVLQLGASDTKWIAETGGSPDLQRGLGIFVPIDTTPHFDRLKLQLVNVGMDFVGKNQRPLVDLGRLALGGVSPRGVLAFDFAGGAAPTQWGAEVTLDDIGISLTPSAVTEHANPVAQNLLGSSSTDPKPGDGTTATNPTFSVRAGYLHNAAGSLYLELFQGDDTSTSEIWFPVQRSFGPLHVNMIGVSWDKVATQAGVLFDGNVSLAGLYVGLQQLAVSFDVTHPTDYSRYTLDLAGLDIQFKNGSVDLSGGFFKVEQDGILRYDGAATLRIGTFSLDALGSYALVPIAVGSSTKAVSLFVFVNINAPLGGPPAFFVTGLAAGFGYNRDILIPQPGDIGGFPMVAGATNPDFFGKNADGKADPTTALMKLSEVVQPQLGSYWVAAGIKFSSFELINSFVLLFVKFGRQFEIDLVGVSSASLPPNSPETIAYVELGLVASFKPDEGVISVRAQLTPNSYLLAPPCRLTGGFALVIWFSGDFVITLGGYHPAYSRPDNYPDVPRLGFIWPMDVSVGRLTIAGGAYFALTPTAVMAGGYLRVAFVMGPIRAWLDAGADFLIQWKPFYYDIGIHVSVGIEFHTEIAGVSITLSASLGASLHIWGPETRGVAEINWYVISFTIPIGNQNQSLETQPLKDWNEFATNFLPPAGADAPRSLAAASSNAAAVIVLKSSASAGLLKEHGPHGWLVNPSAWQLRVDTAVPATMLTVTNAKQTFAPGVPMGVRPMNLPAVDTPLSVTIQGFDATNNTWVDVQLAARNVDATASFIDAASALWSKNALNLDTPPTGPATLSQTYAGVRVAGADTTLADPIGPIPLEQAFEFVTIQTLYYPKPPVWPIAAAVSQSGAFARLTGTIMRTANPSVVAMRREVLKELRAHNVDAVIDPQLSVIAAHAEDVYQAPPMLAEIGGAVPTVPPFAVAAAPARIGAAPPVAALAQPAKVTLQSAANRYLGSTPTARTSATPGPSLLLRSTRAFGRSVNEPRLGAEPRGIRAFASAAPSDGQVRFQVLEGGSAVCAVDASGGGSVAAAIQGGLPVRLIQLNEHDEVVDDTLQPAASTVQLRPDVRSVAFHAHTALAVTPTVPVGWQSDTLLMQVGRYTFVAEGCTVRPQASPIRRVGGRHVSRGLIEGAQVVAQNRVRGSGGVFPGWIETLLPGSPAAVTVIVAGGNVSDAAGVTVKFAAAPKGEAPRYAGAASHAVATAAEEGFVLCFDVPDAQRGAPSLAILVQTSGALKLCGVWGAATDAASMAARWSELSAHASGIRPTTGAPPYADVRVTVR